MNKPTNEEVADAFEEFLNYEKEARRKKYAWTGISIGIALITLVYMADGYHEIAKSIGFDCFRSRGCEAAKRLALLSLPAVWFLRVKVGRLSSAILSTFMEKV